MAEKKTTPCDYKSTTLCGKLSAKKLTSCIFFDRPLGLVYAEKIKLGRKNPDRNDFLYQITVDPYIDSVHQDVIQWVKVLKGTRIVQFDVQEILQNKDIRTWDDLAVLWKVSKEMAREITRVASDKLFFEFYSRERCSRCIMYNEIFA